MQNKLFNTDPAKAKKACDTLREHLADQTPHTTTSLIYEGVTDLIAPLGLTVTKAHTKLGILPKLRSEFAYIEADGLKYAVLAMGIFPKRDGGINMDEETRGKELGKAIHRALKASP